jgi:hypothetical protein
MGSQMRMKPARRRISEIYRGVSDSCPWIHAGADTRRDQ